MSAGTAPSPFPWRDYIAPRHWPTWLGIGAFAALARLPLDAQLAIGRALGRLLHALLPSRRRIARINVDLAFPESSAAARAAIVRQSFIAAGSAIAETACVWFRPQGVLGERIRLEGEAHVEAALAAGRGVIILQAHFTAIDVCAPAIGSRWPSGCVYDNPKNPLYAAMLAWQRSRWASPMIDNRDIRTMVRHLRKGGIVWYSPDQSIGAHRGGIATRFFDQPVLTTSGTARIVAMTGAAIVQHIPVREPQGNRYTLRFLPAVSLPEDDVTAATQAVNDLLEQHVRAQPGQYLWAHRRFKPPDKSLPDPYRQPA